MDEGIHGMVTMIKHMISFYEAQQIYIGDGTDTLSTRIWVNNKPFLKCIQSRWRSDVTTPLTSELRSMMKGDSNDMLYIDHNRAGRLLNDQLRNLYNYSLFFIPLCIAQSIHP